MRAKTQRSLGDYLRDLAEAEGRSTKPPPGAKCVRELAAEWGRSEGYAFHVVQRLERRGMLKCVGRFGAGGGAKPRYFLEVRPKRVRSTPK